MILIEEVNVSKAESELKKQVWARLKQVLDPELNINLVDLGLIYKVEVRALNSSDEKSIAPQIYILMTLTTPGCPLATVFDPMIRENLLGLRWCDAQNKSEEGRPIDIDTEVEIELTFDPPWVADMMSEKAKAELGMD